MCLPKQFVDSHQIVKYKFEKVFPSKKNKVMLVYTEDFLGKSNRFVLKYKNRGIQKENNILIKLYRNGFNVPKVYYHNDQMLLMEYLPANTLLETILDFERKSYKVDDERVIKITYNFLAWLDQFYNFTGLTLQDCNLRNFLVSNNDIYGVDFEDCAKGKREEDLARISAFILLYSPEYTDWKVKFSNLFLDTATKEFNLDKDRLIFERSKQVKAIKRRRMKKSKAIINNETQK
ncbi:RIO1 family regulatory kinase/ATPase [Proteinivorax hydrogeniformans]|uniref:non-specific serine/threonine protein kinase n=1 Tax=Proteinivorax hydrogeniformans TaxID=1826727 RepID=A0AAU8HRT7_9FIRM